MFNARRLVKQDKGFAMIEALVTALIVAIGVSGVGVLLMRAIQGTQDSAQQSQAMWVVQDFVGRLRANPEAAKNKDYVISNAINCATPPATLCAAQNVSGTSTPTNVCTSTDMAVFDAWTTVCGMDDSIFDSSSDFIAKPVITSTCTLSDATTGECYQYNVELSWSIKLTKGSADKTERTNTNSYSMVVGVN